MAAATMSALKLTTAPPAAHLKSQFTGEPLANLTLVPAPPARSASSLVARASSSSSQNEASSPQQANRRATIFTLMSAAASLVAASRAGESRAVADIKINGAPPPSGGLPGTENADQPRDLDLPLKERYYIQPVSPAEAVSRIKDASKDIIGVKELIAKKSWPYVRNDLRSKATYLRYDLNTIISAKPKEERKAIKKLTTKLFETLDKLDFAARSKDPAAAEKSYAEAVAALDSVIAKISA